MTAAAISAEGAIAFAGAEVRLEPNRNLGRVAVGEEVGEPRLRCAPGAGEVEDDGGDEFFVVEAGGAGDAIAGGDRKQKFTEPVRRHPRRKVAQLGVDLEYGLVEEGGGPGEELDRVERRQFGAGPGDRLRPLRHLAGETALEAQQTEDVRSQDQPLQIPLDEHHHRFLAKGIAHLLRRLVGGAVAVDQGPNPGISRDPGNTDPGGNRQHETQRQHRPGVPSGPRRDAAEPLPSAQLSWDRP